MNLVGLRCGTFERLSSEMDTNDDGIGSDGVGIDSGGLVDGVEDVEGSFGEVVPFRFEEGIDGIAAAMVNESLEDGLQRGVILTTLTTFLTDPPP